MSAAARTTQDEARRWALAARLALVAADTNEAARIVRTAGEALPAITILDEVVAPAMREVGVLWETDKITVADEHLATATAQWLIAQIAPQLTVEQASSRGQTVMLICPPSERHTIGLLMAEVVLRGAGYDVRNVAGGVPLGDMAETIRRCRPDIIGVAITMATYVPELTATIDAAVSAAPDARVLLGGSAVPPGFRHRGVELADSMQALVSLLT